MRKLSKILFLLLIATMIVFTFSAKVNASDEFDNNGYTELGGEEISTENKNTTTEETKEDAKEETKEETTNTIDTATTSHPQAGIFINTLFVAAGLTGIVAIALGYSKLKKYNF